MAKSCAVPPAPPPARKPDWDCPQGGQAQWRMDGKNASASCVFKNNTGGLRMPPTPCGTNCDVRLPLHTHFLWVSGCSTSSQAFFRTKWNVYRRSTSTRTGIWGTPTTNKAIQKAAPIQISGRVYRVWSSVPIRTRIRQARGSVRLPMAVTALRSRPRAAPCYSTVQIAQARLAVLPQAASVTRGA